MVQITMKTQLDIDTLLKTGSIKDELDYERDEHVNWLSSSQISKKKLEENEHLPFFAEGSDCDQSSARKRPH
jgi:hypothetical protein